MCQDRETSRRQITASRVIGLGANVTGIFPQLHRPAAGDTHRRVLVVLTYLRTQPLGCGYPHP
jgi:hypothetical protein